MTTVSLAMAGVSLTVLAWRGPVPPEARDQAGVAEPAAERADTVPARPPNAPAAPQGRPAAAAPAPAATQPGPAAAAASPPAGPATPTATPPRAAEGAETSAPPGGGAARAQSPGELVRAPSLYETGRIGNAAVPEPGVPAQRGVERAARPELRVQAKQPERHDGPTRASYTGVVDQTALDRELGPRFRLLGDCKSEVARRKHVHASAITGSHLLLRWTILPDGRVTDTQVVATSPADPRVVDCIKQRMSTWAFAPARGGQARVERKFSFP